MRSTVAACLLAATCLALPALAERPSAQEVTRVLEYFNNGKGQGPVLLEMTPCLEIGRPDGEKKKRCIKPIEGAVPSGTTAYVFMRFVVPRGDSYNDIVVEWLRAGDSDSQSNVAVSTSWSYGIWKARALTRAGTWTVRVRRGDQILGESQIVVQ